MTNTTKQPNDIKHALVLHKYYTAHCLTSKYSGLSPVYSKCAEERFLVAYRDLESLPNIIGAWYVACHGRLPAGHDTFEVLLAEGLSFDTVNATSLDLDGRAGLLYFAVDSTGRVV